MAQEPILDQLKTALRKRVEIIANHAWRDRDSVEHLAALKTISERIVALQLKLPPTTNPLLLHYLERSSYTKALAYLEDPENKQPTHF